MKNNHDKPGAGCFRLAMLALAAWLLISNTSFGQDGRLSVDLAGSSPRIRSNAPVQLLLKTYWNGSSIVEGHFEMQYLSDGVTRRSDCKSHDMVLTPGEQVIRLIMPSGGSSVSYGQDQVRLKFVMPDETIDLGKYPLVASPADRSMNVCVIGPTEDRNTSDAEAEVTDSMRLNALLVPTVNARSVTTLYTRWDNIDVPEQAFHFCSFDLVLVRPDGLSDLRKKQMDALLTWVRAGGSVCVMLSEDLKGTHVEFLNQLIAERHETPFALDTTGKFVPDDQSSDVGIWTSHLELGRVAIVDLEKVAPDLDVLWKDCRRMAVFLWKVRKDRKASVLSQSRASVERKRQGSEDYKEDFNNQYRNRGYAQLAWQPVQTTGQFINRLMPKDVKTIPMFLIAMVLLGYLILIGPVDYYVLGFFRRRRYTWITFPLMTAAVSLLCVGVSDAYLSSKTGGRSLTVRDIGADGGVLRETRFQMRFLSRRAKVETEVQNEIFTPLDQDRLNMNAQYVAYSNPSAQNTKKIPAYTGRIPSDYVVEQEIPQWTPQINRFLAIAPDKKVDGFAWEDKSLIAKSNRDRLQKTVSQKWPTGTAIVFHRKEREFVVGNQIFDPQEIGYDARYGAQVRRQRQRLMRQDRTEAMASFMDSLCVRSPRGLFQFVSQISPTGGDNFEDVTIYDTTDGNQALLVIAIDEGDDLVVYRRLYTDLND